MKELEAFAKRTEEEIKRKTPEVDNALDWALRTPGVIPKEPYEQTWLEFGVFQGTSLAKLARAKREGVSLWGFDAFRGLPEFWRTDPNVPGGALGKGFFGMDRIPHPPDGAGYVVGWYEDTLRSIEFQAPITLVHVDADLYSSTKTIHRYLFGARDTGAAKMMKKDPFGHDLHWRVPRIVKGAIVVYDELFCPPWDNGELRALYEDMTELGMKLEWLAWQLDKVVARVV
jgi:hypothetical protein